MTATRLITLTILLCIMIFSTFMPAGLATVSGQSGQPTQLSQVNNSLMSAFQAVRSAEQKGASNESLAPLITELNEALSYEMIAEQGNYNSTAAIQSITLSNDVTMKAEALGNQAQTSSQERTTLAYLIAILLAFVSSLAIIEAGRIRRFLDRRKLLHSRIEMGGK